MKRTRAVPLDTGGIELELELDPPHAVIASKPLTTAPARRNLILSSIKSKFVRAANSSAHERFGLFDYLLKQGEAL
jgi:hypothetical protein